MTSLDALRNELGLVMAVGDGANDLDIVDAAGMGVAFRAKPIVAAAAYGVDISFPIPSRY